MEEYVRQGSETINTQSRFLIDIVKGFAIFLMLYGHCIQYCAVESDILFYENSVFNIIYSFHMPLFMLVSGFLFYFSFSKYSLKELLVRKTQSLIQPIVFGSMLICLIAEVPLGIISGDYSNIFDGAWLKKLPSIWFLWSVLSASIVLAVICKNVHKVGLQIPALILSSIIIAFFPNSAENLFMYPFFLTGFYYAQFREKTYRFQKLKYLSFILYPVLMYIYKKNNFIFVAMNFSDMSSVTEICFFYCFKWILGLVGSIFVLSSLNLLNRKMFNNALWIKIGSCFANLGKKSLQIYVLSIPFLSSFLSVAFPLALTILDMENFFAKNTLIYTFVFTPTFAFVYAVGLYCAIHFLEKWKISRIIFGR